jgi:hypothetical protein
MYDLDKSVFDSLNKDSCYWLGFTYGDGSVSKYAIRYELSNIDKDHLVKIKDFFKSSSPIRSCKKKCSRINISSKELSSKVQKLGIVINKTYQKEIPDIPKENYCHFIRGILDSDGWIVKHNNKFNIPQYEFGFSSNNEQLLQQIKSFIESTLNKNKVGSLRKTKSCYQLIIGGNKQFISIADIIYKDSEEENRLTRKYNKYLEAKIYIQERKDMRHKT